MIKLVSHIIVGLSILGLTSPCFSLEQKGEMRVKGWVMAGRDSTRQNSANETVRLPLVFKCVYGSGKVKSQVSVAEDMVYYRDGARVHATDVNSGKIVWQYTLESYENTSAPAINKDFVIVGGDKGLYAIDRHTGQLRWLMQGAAVTSSPLIDEEFVYYGDLAGKVHKISIDNAKAIWTKEVTSEIFMSLSCTENLIYVSSSQQNIVCALGNKDGSLAWQFNVNGRSLTSPVVAGNSLIVTTERGMIFALDKNTGEKIWSFQTLNFIASPLAADAHVVYVASMDGYLYALTLDKGETLWKFAAGKTNDKRDYLNTPLGINHPMVGVPTGALSGVLLSLNTVVIVSNDDFLYILDNHNGRILWKDKIEGSYDAPPTLWNGKLFIPLNSFSVVCYESAPNIDFFLTGKPVKLSGPAAAIRNKVIMIPHESLKNLGLQYEWTVTYSTDPKNPFDFAENLVMKGKSMQGIISWRQGKVTAQVNKKTYQLPEKPYPLPPYNINRLKVEDHRWMIPADFVKTMGVNLTWKVKREQGK